MDSLRQRGLAVDDELADYYLHLGEQFTEDEYVQGYATQILGEERREPVYWRDSRFNLPTQPVVGINWYEAMAYAAWLARLTGKAYRLPTEAEWEWAARRSAARSFWAKAWAWGAQRSVRRYPWVGPWAPDRCNWSGSQLNQPNPVGIFPQGCTPDGLAELAGNVYEWTVSLYRPYPYLPGDGREDPLASGLRVARGGSWYTGPDRVRCASRDQGRSLGHGHHNLGCRLARTLS